MADSAVQKRVEQLRKELEHHNYLYYVQTKPEISDREYDALMQELIDLETKYPELITPDSPSQRVGGEPIEGFRTVEHAERMYSIDNTYDEEDVRQFDERVRKLLPAGATVEYVCEPKVDGVACSLRYEDGVLVLGATRGDGRRGDEITHNVKVIRSVPLKLKDGKKVPEIVEVRGEVYMANADFQKLNQRLEAEGTEPLKNPRNATAGTLKQLDPKIVASRRLSFVAHGAGQVEPQPVETYWDWIQLVKHWGFAIGEGVKLCKSIDEVIEHIEAFAKVRGTLPFQTDGVVVKVNSLEQRETLGFTAKAPRWVIAFKYPAEQVQTVLHGVRWQVGKGGALTPVADLEPVFVGGTTVRRATLHNIEQIERLGIHIGDTVVVEKAGEVIPYISQAISEKRPKDAKAVHAPKKCPSCGEPVEKEKGTPIIRCNNAACPDQVRERLIWFVGRRQMDIEGLGEKILDQLMETGKVKTFADVFRLSVPDIAELTRDVKREDKTVVARVGEKTAEKILKSAEEAKSRGLARVLASLGIPHVGATMAEEIAEAFGDIDTLEKASEGDIRNAMAKGANQEEKEAAVLEGAKKLHEALHGLMGKSLAKEIATAAEQEDGAAKVKDLLAKEKVKVAKPELVNLLDRYGSEDELIEASAEELADAMIGRVVARSLYDWLHSKQGGKTIEELRAVGVKFSTPNSARAEVPAGAEAGEFAGKTFVITGGFEKFTRDELREKVKALGGKVTDSVSKNTDVLLCGTDAGSKLDKAQSLKIRVWEEGELLKKLGIGG